MGEKGGEKVNKKVLIIFVALMAMAALATPLVGMVTAEPTEGQKVPVTIQWTPTGTTTLERNDTDGLSHRLLRTTWNVKLFIDGSATPIDGTAVSIRHVLYAYAKLQMAVYEEYYELTFPTEGGGFEGNGHILLTDYAGGTNYDVRIHALFHGTGAYEGQTLNVGRDKGPASFVWEGYLLKP